MKKISSQNGAVETTIFTYDALDRLLDFTASTPQKTERTEYEYFIYNRKTETVTEDDLVKKERNYYYDDTNQLTLVEDVTDSQNPFNILYFYDNNGNTIERIDGSLTNQPTGFTYNSLDQLVQATRGPPGAETLLGQYDYNASGLRVRHRYSERGDVDYYYDENAVLEEFNASDNSLLAHYTYADRLLRLNTGVGIQYYHHDALGSTVNLTDSDGNTLVSYTLDPWGRIRSQSGSSINRQIFTGQEHDENTGLINFGVRYYNPDLARFLTQDAYLGDNTIPPSLHRYLYAYSNPTVYVDLLGREAYTPSTSFGAFDSVYGDTTWIDKPADEYDKFAHNAYKKLEETVKEHPWSLPAAAVGSTLVYTGQEVVDVLRLGEGSKGGGWGRIEDLLRCTEFLGPFSKPLKLLKKLKHNPSTLKKKRILTEETPEPGGHQGTSIGELEQDIEVNELLEGRNAPEFAEPTSIKYPAIGNKFDDLILSKGQGGWYCSGPECIVAPKRGLGDASTSPWLLDNRVGVTTHIESFREGGSYLVPKSVMENWIQGKNMIGRPDGQFITSKASMDRLLDEAGGSLSTIKERLGIPQQYWNEEIYRIDIHNPLLHNARLPSGFESGANELFKWGGYTSGGMSEVVIDQIPAGAFSIVKTGVKP